MCLPKYATQKVRGLLTFDEDHLSPITLQNKLRKILQFFWKIFEKLPKRLPPGDQKASKNQYFANFYQYFNRITILDTFLQFLLAFADEKPWFLLAQPMFWKVFRFSKLLTSESILDGFWLQNGLENPIFFWKMVSKNQHFFVSIFWRTFFRCLIDFRWFWRPKSLPKTIQKSKNLDLCEFMLTYVIS